MYEGAFFLIIQYNIIQLKIYNYNLKYILELITNNTNRFIFFFQLIGIFEF